MSYYTYVPFVFSKREVKSRLWDGIVGRPFSETKRFFACLLLKPVPVCVMQSKLDPARLPAKKEGWTKEELAKHFKTSLNVVSAWLTKIRHPARGTSMTKGFSLELIRTPDRYVIKKARKK